MNVKISGGKIEHIDRCLYFRNESANKRLREEKLRQKDAFNRKLICVAK